MVLLCRTREEDQYGPRALSSSLSPISLHYLGGCNRRINDRYCTLIRKWVVGQCHYYGISSRDDGR